MDLDAGQETSEVGLASSSTAPHLSDDGPVGQRCSIVQAFVFDEGDDIAVASLDRDERAPALLRRRGDLTSSRYAVSGDASASASLRASSHAVSAAHVAS